MNRICFCVVWLVLSQVAVGQAHAQRVLAQSTERIVRICGAVAVGDGFTPVTSLSLSTADEAEALREGTATLDISGATFAAITSADGCYDLTLSTTATSAIGELTILIQDDSLILPIWAYFQVVEEAIYAACCEASATPLTAAAVVDNFETQSQADPTGFHVNVLEQNGTAQTARDMGASVLISSGTGTGQLSVSSGVIASNPGTGTIAAADFSAGAIDAAAIATDAIGAAEIAANAIGASELAADAIGASEIADGAIDAATFAADVDAEILSYIVDDATLIDASELNADIDSLTFTVAGQADVNVESVNTVALTGDGSGTPFNVASFRDFRRACEYFGSGCAELARREFRAMQARASELNRQPSLMQVVARL